MNENNKQNQLRCLSNNELSCVSGGGIKWILNQVNQAAHAAEKLVEVAISAAAIVLIGGMVKESYPRF